MKWVFGEFNGKSGQWVEELMYEDETGFSFMGFFYDYPIGKSIVLELIDTVEHKTAEE